MKQYALMGFSKKLVEISMQAPNHYQVVRPGGTVGFSKEHDESISTCRSQFLSCSVSDKTIAEISMRAPIHYQMVMPGGTLGVLNHHD